MLRNVIGKASIPTYTQRLGHQEQKVGDGTWDIPKFVDVLCVNMVFPRRVYMHIYIHTILIQFFYNYYTILIQYILCIHTYFTYSHIYTFLYKSVDVYRIRICIHTCTFVHIRTYMRRRTYVRAFIPIIRHQVSPDSPTAAMAAGAMALPW